MSREQALEKAREFANANIPTRYHEDVVPEFAAALLDAQAEGLTDILPTEGTWPDIYEVQEQIIRLRAEAEALRKAKP